jgi:transposase-like protein
MVYLWRAVDHEGEVLESYITKTRDKAAAMTFMRKTLKRHGRAEAITTDGLRSYKAAMDELGCAQKQEIGRWTNNRVENNHLPFRRRERAMLRFRQMESLQKFASVHGSIHNHSHGEFLVKARQPDPCRSWSKPDTDAARRQAVQTHIRSPVGPASPISRFRRLGSEERYQSSNRHFAK